jgi:hypothetical protein
MLLSGRATITGAPAIGDFVVRAPSGALEVVSVVGHPAHDVIATTVEDASDMTLVIAQSGNAGYVGQALLACRASSAGDPWIPERAILHRLVVPTASVAEDDAGVRLLRPEDPLDHLPSSLRVEIDHARQTAPVGVATVDARAVSYCYPCWTTESLWDVSIDTLEDYRRLGLAARVARFMIALMQRQGREPVWGAMESNVASLALARTLGFSPVDEIVVFSRCP